MQVMISLTHGIEKITELESFKNVVELAEAELDAMFTDIPDAATAFTYALMYCVSERIYDYFATPFCLQLEKSTAICTDEFILEEKDGPENLKQISYNDWIDSRVALMRKVKDKSLTFYSYKGLMRTKLTKAGSISGYDDKTFDAFYRRCYKTYLNHKSHFDEKVGQALDVLIADLEAHFKTKVPEEIENMKKFFSGDLKATYIVSP